MTLLTLNATKLYLRTFLCKEKQTGLLQQSFSRHKPNNKSWFWQHMLAGKLALQMFKVTSLHIGDKVESISKFRKVSLKRKNLVSTNNKTRSSLMASFWGSCLLVSVFILLRWFELAHISFSIVKPQKGESKSITIYFIGKLISCIWTHLRSLFKYII